MACKRTRVPSMAEQVALSSKRLRCNGFFSRCSPSAYCSAAGPCMSPYTSARCASDDFDAPSTSASPFDALPEDVLALIVGAAARRAASPSDLANIASVCHRMRVAASLPSTLAALRPSALLSLAPAASVSLLPSYRSFLRRVAGSGNAEAQHLLGMIEFYCLGNRKEGVRLLVRASKSNHAGALHSLAVIHFNGSGSASGSSDNSDGASAGGERKLSVGVLLCASAAQQGHVEALRELGHCLQDGYGIRRNVAEGRRLLMEANIREFVACHVASVMGIDGAEVAEQLGQEQIQQLEAMLTSVKGSSNQDLLPVPQTDARTAEEGYGAAAPSPKELPQAAGRFFSMTDLHVPTGLPTQQPAASGRTTESSRLIDSATTSDADAPATSPSTSATSPLMRCMLKSLQSLMSDWGCSLPSRPTSTANRFLVEWNRRHRPCHHSATTTDGGADGCTKGCGNELCGRWETRAREFRCCAVCSVPSYCSRACQALDWRAGHMSQCQQQQQQQQRRGEGHRGEERVGQDDEH